MDPFRSSTRQHQSRCLLSDPADPHTLHYWLGLPPSDCFTCGKRCSGYNGAHYYCEVCYVYFHFLCHYRPREMRHLFHPQHPLSFTFVDESGALVPNGNIVDYEHCVSEHGEPELGDSHGKCDWCGQGLGAVFYRCSVCNFGLDLDCSMLDPPLTISNPRNHAHDITFLSRPFLTPCDACGLVDVRDPAYACHQCSYVVHDSCIDLPRVIKIMYHSHRLSYTPYLPLGNWSCEVCHQKVDVKYGAYACKEGCPSFFHSKCATRRDKWDGKELEWKPEEPIGTRDIQPFEKINSKTILHFSHQHHLILKKCGSVHDANKQCEACVLPIYFGDFYTCKQCDFFLHTTCASLSQKKEHVLHIQPLILDPLPPQGLSITYCLLCDRWSSGFTYSCNECGKFQVDARCASVSNTFNHKGHHHPLAISDYATKPPCEACDRTFAWYNLQCIDGCNFKLCFECATLPNEVWYKYDEHLLTLCYDEDVSGIYWCEVCERKLNPKRWFYTCNECGVTLHVQCVIGPPESMSMKIGHRIAFGDGELEIAHNNGSTRPLCHRCHNRCQNTIYFKGLDESFCSLKCLGIEVLLQ